MKNESSFSDSVHVDQAIQSSSSMATINRMHLIVLFSFTYKNAMLFHCFFHMFECDA